MSLLRLPLKGPLENELNGNEKWHHYYCSSIADVSILQITFLATLRGFSLNTTSFTTEGSKKTYGSKVSLYGFIETTSQARNSIYSRLYDSNSSQEMEIGKGKKFAFESLVMNLS